MLTMFPAALDQTIVATALRPSAGNSADRVQPVMGDHPICWHQPAVAPVFGTLSDIYGRRRMIITAMSLFISGSYCARCAEHAGADPGARPCRGSAGGAFCRSVQTVIADVVTRASAASTRPISAGVWMAAGIADRSSAACSPNICLVDYLLDQRPLGLAFIGDAAAENGQDPGIPQKRKSTGLVACC